MFCLPTVNIDVLSTFRSENKDLYISAKTILKQINFKPHEVWLHISFAPPPPPSAISVVGPVPPLRSRVKMNLLCQYFSYSKIQLEGAISNG